MKTNKLLTWLFEQYQNVNEKVPFINCGGCGVFAENLFLLLTSLNLKPQLIVITDNSKGMDSRIKGEENDYFNENGFASITHIVVKVGKKFIDSSGIYTSIDKVCSAHKYSNRQRQVSNILTLDKLKKWNADKYIWNSRFNRKHIKKIETTLNECYKKYEKNLVESKELPIFTA